MRSNESPSKHKRKLLHEVLFVLSLLVLEMLNYILCSAPISLLVCSLKVTVLLLWLDSILYHRRFISPPNQSVINSPRFSSCQTKIMLTKPFRHGNQYVRRNLKQRGLYIASKKLKIDLTLSRRQRRSEELSSQRLTEQSLLLPKAPPPKSNPLQATIANEKTKSPPHARRPLKPSSPLQLPILH